MTRECLQPECQEPHYAKGLCRGHYEQRRRGRSLKRLKEYTDEICLCAIPECSNEFPQRAIGSRRLYCSRRCRDLAGSRRRRNNPKWTDPKQRPDWPKCQVDGCEKPKLARSLCSMHYERLKKYGTPGEAESRKTPGKWRKTSAGYLRRHFEGRHELQHRVVMEATLGRPLHKYETVHHVNGDRSDNRVENLELWVRSQPAGQRIADIIEWICREYPDLVLANLKGTQHGKKENGTETGT